jgi:hypothetical protein
LIVVKAVVKDSVAQVRVAKAAVVKDSVAQVRKVAKVVQRLPAVVKDSVAQVRKVAKAAQRLPADVMGSQAVPDAANPEIRITRYFNKAALWPPFFV